MTGPVGPSLPFWHRDDAAREAAPPTPAAAPAPEAPAPAPVMAPVAAPQYVPEPYQPAYATSPQPPAFQPQMFQPEAYQPNASPAYAYSPPSYPPDVRQRESMSGSFWALMVAILLVAGGVGLYFVTRGPTHPGVIGKVPSDWLKSELNQVNSPSNTPIGGALPTASNIPNIYPSGGGIAVTSTGDHFRANFPAEPTQIGPASQKIDGVTVKVRGWSYVDAGGSVTVEHETFSAPVPNAGGYSAPSSVVAGMASSLHLTVLSKLELTFAGHPAIQAQLESQSGDKFSAVVFIVSGSSVYVLFATSGPTFATLSQSFHLLP